MEKQRTAIGLPRGLFAQVPGVPTWAQSCLKRRKHVIFNLLPAQDIGCEAKNVPHVRRAPLRCHEHFRRRIRIPGRPDVSIGQNVVCDDGERHVRSLPVGACYRGKPSVCLCSRLCHGSVPGRAEPPDEHWQHVHGDLWSALQFGHEVRAAQPHTLGRTEGADSR
jgi:hypothetical protein